MLRRLVLQVRDYAMIETQPSTDPKPTPGSPPEDQAAGRLRHREELLDEASEESFPASDPPAVFRPEHPRE
jgi:hypothetical protein